MIINLTGFRPMKFDFCLHGVTLTFLNENETFAQTAKSLLLKIILLQQHLISCLQNPTIQAQHAVAFCGQLQIMGDQYKRNAQFAGELAHEFEYLGGGVTV